MISRSRFTEAESQLRRAQQLDPLATLPMINLAELWFYARRLDLEEVQLRKVLDRDPGHVLARTMLAKLEIVSGRPKEAIAEMKNLLAMPEGGAWCQQLAEAYMRDGQRAVALREMTVCAVPPLPSFFLYMGQREHAIDTLKKQYDAHYPYIVYLNVDSTYDSLRSDPEFQKLLRKLGFP